MDSITNGLDAATTFDIVAATKIVCEQVGNMAVMALLQVVVFVNKPISGINNRNYSTDSRIVIMIKNKFMIFLMLFFIIQ